MARKQCSWGAHRRVLPEVSHGPVAFFFGKVATASPRRRDQRRQKLPEVQGGGCLLCRQKEVLLMVETGRGWVRQLWFLSLWFEPGIQAMEGSVGGVLSRIQIPGPAPGDLNSVNQGRAWETVFDKFSR